MWLQGIGTNLSSLLGPKYHVRITSLSNALLTLRSVIPFLSFLLSLLPGDSHSVQTSADEKCLCVRDDLGCPSGRIPPLPGTEDWK